MSTKDDLRGFWNPDGNVLYKTIRKKAKSKCHIVNMKTGMTYCKAENGSRRLNETCEVIPPGKRVCELCVRLSKRRQTRKPTPRKVSQDTGDFYQSVEWAKLRYEVLKDAKRCLCCGASKRQARLTVDHIKSVRRYPELRLDRNNLQVLCTLCNRGKGGVDETDFRGEDLNDVVFTELDDESRQGGKLN